jgi:catechol 2,3-dioxygenase-like lactoylglutathione lyase family enzyme
MALSLTSLDHLVITAADVTATCDFYTRVLGMRVEDFKGSSKALFFAGHRINVHQQGQELAPRAATPTPGSADFCLITDQPMAEVAAHLEAEGVSIEIGPVPRQGALGAMTSVYFRDPDMNLVEIARYER